MSITTEIPVGVVNDYHVGYADLDHTGASFLTVLVHDHDDTFKVYSALVKLPAPSGAKYEAARKRAGREVALHGTPENYERAITFFPYLKREQYRG